MCRRRGKILGRSLHDTAQNHPCVTDVRGLGFFWTFDLKSLGPPNVPVRKYTEKYTKSIIVDIADYLLNNKKIYITSDKFGIWVVPPLVATSEDLDMIVSAIDDALHIADMHFE